MPNHAPCKIVSSEMPPDLRCAVSESVSAREGGIHVWFVRLAEMHPHLGYLLGVLAPDEAAKAARFRFASDRDEYSMTRGLLRHILGYHTGFAPHRLAFRYSPYGKPELDLDWGGDAIAFNLSHSHGVAVYAVTRNREVGVDLEYMNQWIDFDPMVERFFSAREISLFRELPVERKREAFFSCWTRKEAYSKARGEGLSLDLRGLDVTLVRDQPPGLLPDGDDSAEARRWYLSDLHAPPGYAAALAVEKTVRP